MIRRRAAPRRALCALIAARALLAPAPAHSQAAPPAGHEDDAFDVMNLLARHHMHELQDERWNAYGQFTYITNFKLPFNAAYTNANGSVNSLVPGYERSFTGTITLFLGARLWPGAEAYLVPEVIAERALSNLHGLGASIQNFELQKQGSESPSLYRARLFLRQTINFGGHRLERSSDPLQLGSTVDSRRVVITVGNFTVLDLFDRNNVSWDPRQTFLNMAFMTHAAWDFASDARGYSWGGAVELYWDAWALRLSRAAPPLHPNSLPIDLRLWQFYGDSIELEHDHVLLGQRGAVRLLAYRNFENVGRFDDAIAAFQADPRHNAGACTEYNYNSGNFTAPDLCWVRKPNAKLGIGLNVEQYITPHIGIFARVMYSDGQTEVDAFDPADRSVSIGAVARGQAWHRPFDVAGIGGALGWISDIHAQYLGLGGVDGFVGDGRIQAAPEGVAEVFYSFNLLRAIWLTGDYQIIVNPGFNADRGPVHIPGVRVHAEF